MRTHVIAAFCLALLASPAQADGPSFTDLESAPTTTYNNSQAFMFVCAEKPIFMAALNCYSPIGVGKIKYQVSFYGQTLYAYGATANGKSFCIAGTISSIEYGQRIYPMPASYELAAGCMTALSLGSVPDLYFFISGEK